MRFVSRIIAVAMLLTAAEVEAQRVRTEYGVGLDYRRQLGSLPDSVDRRKGLAIRIQADVPWNNHFGWRIEGGYAQMQYDLQAPAGLVPINETNIELGGYLRAFPRRDAKLRPYLLAGPTASLRASCEIDIAFGSSDLTACGEEDDFLFGWGAGLGVRLADWVGGWAWFAEARMLSNVTAAGGGRLIAISIGAGAQ